MVGGVRTANRQITSAESNMDAALFMAFDLRDAQSFDEGRGNLRAETPPQRETDEVTQEALKPSQRVTPAESQGGARPDPG